MASSEARFRRRETSLSRDSRRRSSSMASLLPLNCCSHIRAEARFRNRASSSHCSQYACRCNSHCCPPYRRISSGFPIILTLASLAAEPGSNPVVIRRPQPASSSAAPEAFLGRIVEPFIRPFRGVGGAKSSFIVADQLQLVLEGGVGVDFGHVLE